MSDKNDDKHNFNILVCIDGSEESYRGLHYAIKFSLDNPDTDIALLYVRSTGGSGGRSSGLNMELSREAMLDWDLELPGLKSLKKARNMLVESGFLGDGWNSEDITKKFRGTRSGDHIIKYSSKKTGQRISSDRARIKFCADRHSRRSAFLPLRHCHRISLTGKRFWCGTYRYVYSHWRGHRA